VLELWNEKIRMAFSFCDRIRLLLVASEVTTKLSFSLTKLEATRHGGHCENVAPDQVSVPID